MTNEQLIQDIITSNETLRIQLWILGGALTVLFLVMVGFAKSAWVDMRTMLENHDLRINLHEKNQAVMDQKIENLIEHQN